jgi:hypothetical protein
MAKTTAVAAATTTTQVSKTAFITKLLKSTSKRKTPLSFKEIEAKVKGAGYNSLYRSELYRIQDQMANA